MIDILHAPLPYEARLPGRTPDDVDLVVIHCTELPDLAMAREYGERVLYEDRGTGASGHYYVDRDGAILCYVDPMRTANHTRGYNPRSIGIELVNLGRYPDWFDSRRQVMTEPYPKVQIDALRGLLQHLVERFSSLRHIAGHEDLDTAMVPASDNPDTEVPRKRDPGPQFPWERALAGFELTRLAGHLSAV